VNASDDERDVMIAVTFAEAGDWETARRYARPPPGRAGGAWLERHLAAAALAEEGLQDEALRMIEAEAAPAPPRIEDALDALLASHGLRMSWGALQPSALAARS
jgi:hypothetical protein